ncbi:MAG: hypothetical protein JO250_03560 [Armatimonadetes bacterium]|nr:hypothetical protein [Armatimonadota bacterium]
MSQTTISQERAEPAAPAKKPGLPAFRPLAGTAFAANAPLLAWLLIAGRLGTALSVLAGLGVGLAVYGSLHLFVGRGLDSFVAGIRGRATPPTGGATTLFAVLLPLKYLLIGGLMFLLIRGGHLSLFWFVIGFLVTQVAITVATVIHLAKQPRW